MAAVLPVNRREEHDPPPLVLLREGRLDPHRTTHGLVGHRSASPWDDEPRRPSHADKRRELLGEEIRSALRPGVSEREIHAAAERLLDLAA